MKFFWVKRKALLNIGYGVSMAVIFLLTGCATHHVQYGVNAGPPADSTAQTPAVHRFYLVGDAGYANAPHAQKLLGIIRQKLDKEGKDATLMFMGDNIYPLGMPKEGEEGRREAEESLLAQIAIAKNFKGKTHFIPGNHDWYNGLDGLNEQEKFIKKHIDQKKVFLPGNGCGINDISVGDSITLITIDSQWFIEDWDHYPIINDDCPIKTREQMFTELESLINKNQDKTILLAIHHPLMSNGTHGGQFSMQKQLFPLSVKIPLPVIGTMMNLARKASGASTQDLQSRVYSTLSNRIKTLIQGRNNVVVLSGHDHNLQFLHKDNINQVISGSGSKVEAARAINPDDFSYGGTGYATLDVLPGGLARVTYFALKGDGEEKIFERTMLQKSKPVLKEYPDTFPTTITTSVYTPEMTKKSGFYRFLFGKHYSDVYSRPVTVPVAEIDTLHGGFEPGRMGGGHQSNSLRLVDKKGREFVMRGVKKSATRFLQAVAFKEKYVGDEFENTFAEDFLFDFYTTAHPYTPFVVDKLEEAVGILHTNPELYYIPKQNALKENNELYGDELYMVEEHPGKEFKDLESFGKADDIEGTDDVLANLIKSPKYTVDEGAYIRVRLFDMLVGDWDRHADQWRWARYDGKDKVVYKPIPRDRDQAFPKYDGALLSVVMNVPALRHMQTFKDDIRNVKWLNREPYALDLTMIKEAGEAQWLQEAQYLKEHLTDEAIDKAFAKLPQELQDSHIETIKANLKTRREKLADYAVAYRKVLLSTVMVTGTDKKEKFVITRLPEGHTKVEVYSLKKDGGEKLTEHTYSKKETKEIWVYGLDDDDVFEVKGDPDKAIMLRLIGGQNNDTYTVENGKRVRIYDFKSKKNSYAVDGKTRLMLSDDYETNSYDPEKPAYNVWAGYPLVGYNPDDLLKLGVLVNYTVNNFNRRPYSQKHSIRANYFFATHGFELGYRGTFMNIASRWNFALDALYTSPNFSINFFGWGNETGNDDDDLGMNYNRVKLQVFRVAPSFFKEGRNGSFVEFKAPFETIEVDGTNGRFINQPGAIAERLFEHRQYGGLEALYKFENFDSRSLPSLGMQFYVQAGYKVSLDEIERRFPYAEAGITFVHKITSDNALVFATTVKGKAIFNNNFEFYQAATLGGNELRGFRRERFTGRHFVYQSSDLNYTIGSVKSFIPLKYGLAAGFDYGRVWLPGEESEKWHTSSGGGFWVNGADMLTLKTQLFFSSDGPRLAVNLNFGL
ncbi:metallophosphoesterase [Flavobacterium akiainvivens]|uniref:Metallophosphoesterase n=1 Tax=Flavobacterium akiainvivens TaxID=1202724 RepID=A0A0M9VJV2_9FLAO|nr:metallophosphoesterase [Flavobacterium akiainvivens]KOS07859.1 metallophosphoesterase [Flavobacterium akiainvivens]SFQ27661.1 Calcineurin-like phosphoesterase [Flavobacterium akiainvivens]